MASNTTTHLVLQHSYRTPGQSSISAMSSAALATLLAERGARFVHTTLPLSGAGAAATTATTVTVRQADLLTGPERAAYGHLPNMRNPVVTVRIPWRLRVGRTWDLLHIVSERALEV